MFFLTMARQSKWWQRPDRWGRWRKNKVSLGRKQQWQRRDTLNDRRWKLRKKGSTRNKYLHLVRDEREGQHSRVKRPRKTKWGSIPQSSQGWHEGKDYTSRGGTGRYSYGRSWDGGGAEVSAVVGRGAPLNRTSVDTGKFHVHQSKSGALESHRRRDDDGRREARFNQREGGRVASLLLGRGGRHRQGLRWSGCQDTKWLTPEGESDVRARRWWRSEVPSGQLEFLNSRREDSGDRWSAGVDSEAGREGKIRWRGSVGGWTRSWRRGETGWGWSSLLRSGRAAEDSEGFRPFRDWREGDATGLGYSTSGRGHGLAGEVPRVASGRANINSGALQLAHPPVGWVGRPGQSYWEWQWVSRLVLRGSAASGRHGWRGNRWPLARA